MFTPWFGLMSRRLGKFIRNWFINEVVGLIFVVDVRTSLMSDLQVYLYVFFEL